MGTTFHKDCQLRAYSCTQALPHRNPPLAAIELQQL